MHACACVRDRKHKRLKYVYASGPFVQSADGLGEMKVGVVCTKWAGRPDMWLLNASFCEGGCCNRWLGPCVMLQVNTCAL